MNHAEVAQVLRDQAAHLSRLAADYESGKVTHLSGRDGGELVDVSKQEAADFRRRAEYLIQVAKAHERSNT